MKAFPCPHCEKANVQKKPHVVMVKIGRYRISDGSGWAWVCPECKEVMHDGKEAERREHSAALVVLHDAEDISGVEMKDIRSIFGFRQTDLAHILDVSPETISRWESGHLAVSTMHRLAMGEVARGVIERGGPEAYMEEIRKKPLKLASGA